MKQYYVVFEDGKTKRARHYFAERITRKTIEKWMDDCMTQIKASSILITFIQELESEVDGG